MGVVRLFALASSLIVFLAAEPAALAAQSCSCRVTVGTQNRWIWGSWALECNGHKGHADCPTTNIDTAHSAGAGAMVGEVQIDARSNGATKASWKKSFGDDHVTAFKGPIWIEGNWEWTNVCSCDSLHNTTNPNAPLFSGAQTSPEYITQGTSGFLKMDYACGDPRSQIVVMERMEENDPWSPNDKMGQIAISFRPEEGVRNVTKWGEHFEPALINGSRTHAGWAGGSYGADIVMTTECYTSGTGPAPVDPGPLNYQGCYTDDEYRALPTWLGEYQTVESCIELAQANGFSYAGLQYYGQCFGGNTKGYTRTYENECNTPCSANPGQACGGPWRNSVYAVPSPGAKPWGFYEGCYTDDEARALPVNLGSNHSPTSCINAAQAAGYKYAGVQWYGECFAGNSVGYVRVDEGECNTPCNANPVEMCGGGWRNNIYATGN